MSIHTHSHMAYEDMNIGGKLSRRQAAILSWLLTRNRPHTDREVAAGMGYPDMNAVRPRITELLRMGVLEEVDAVACPVTRKRVRRIQPAETQSELPL